MERDVSRIRDDFPILDREVNDGVPLVYLDNAATTQTPRQVYEQFDAFYEGFNANVHRGIHTLSHEASLAYERAHDRLASFVGANGREEMVFTKNTTESINLVAYSIGLNDIGENDEIVTTEMEHHASFVTWQQIAERTGADLNYIRVTENGLLDMEHAKEVIGPATAIVSVAHVSNVLGTVNPVETLADMAHANDAYIVVDGAQSAPTRPVDVQDMDADFFAFSGHKMLGPTGIGCLYGKRSILEEMDPFIYGGEMIRNVTFDHSTWNELPWKFEAGTPPIAEAIALEAAVDYLEGIGMDRVRSHENTLAQYTIERLQARDDVEIYGPPAGKERAGLVAFNVAGIHGHDLSSILNDRGIAIRAGDHCTQPLHDILDIPGSARASFYIYNTREEIDRLVETLDNADRKLVEYLSSDRYHHRVIENYRNPHNPTGLDNPTISKHSAETACGDEGEFQLEVSSNGIIENVGFRSESCSVSRAIASLLGQHLEGKSIEYAAALDDEVVDLLEGQFDEIRAECVVGPEDVLRLAAEEHLAEMRQPGSVSS